MTKLNKAQIEALQIIQAAVDELSGFDAADYTFNENAKNIIDERRRRWYASDEYRQHIEACNKRDEARQEKKQNRDRIVAQWVLDNVKPGDIVKMSGCRDGHGIRRVMNVDRRMSGYANITCLAFERIAVGRDNKGDVPELHVPKLHNNLVFVKRAQITEHKPSKVTAVLRDGKLQQVNQLADVDPKA